MPDADGRTAGQGDSFMGDLGLAITCWRRDPRLPLLTLALVVIAFAPAVLQRISPALGALGILVLPVSLFQLGFNGAQRTWYQRLFTGQSMTLGEVWTTSWRMLGRFLVLGLLTAWPVVLATIPWGVMYIVRALSAFTEYVRTHPDQFQYGRPRPGTPDLHLAPVYDGWFALAVVATLLWDFALTFATPALAFTTTSARQSLRIGLAMIRRTWPAAALYVFFPPLALQVLSLAATAGHIKVSPTVYAVSVVITLFNLLAKGAVAAFYLRHQEAVAAPQPITVAPTPIPAG